MGPGKKKISQETFDAAVQENIEEFCMEPEEAVRSALEEFKLQGVDLAGIIKSAEGGTTDKHPVTLAVQSVASLATAPDTSDARLVAALQHLTDAVTLESAEDTAQALAVAAKAQAVPTLLQICKDHSSSAVLVAALQALTAVLAADDNKRALERADGFNTLTALLDANTVDACIAEAVALAAAAAATKHEANKCDLLDSGLANRLIAVTSAPGVGRGVAIAAGKAFRTACSADDDRPLASRAFQNARTLAKAGAVAALLAVLKRAGAADPELAASLCGCLRRLAVNDDICKEFEDGGGIPAVFACLTAHPGDAPVAKSASALLRQLAGSDASKGAIVGAGGLEVMVRVAGVHSGDAGVLEMALGLLAALTLRNPVVAEQAAEEGCLDAVLEVMGGIDENTPPVSAQWVQRQACMSLRNMVARSPQLRPLLLGKGAEGLLRAARTRHPAACADVGGAALRDLGLADYGQAVASGPPVKYPFNPIN